MGNKSYGEEIVERSERLYEEMCKLKHDVYDAATINGVAFTEYNNIFKNVGDIKPSFKVGDVVSHIDNPNGLYVITEIAETDGGKFMYDLTSLDSDDDDKGYLCEETAFKFLYHDTNYEQYFIESVQNGLPGWRGKIYNFYMFYKDTDTHGTLDEDLVKEYNNHTIPPKFMEHILESHSIYDRINAVLGEPEKKKKLMQTLQINNGQLNDIKGSIRKKIDARNLNDLSLKSQGKILEKTKTLEFTDQELEFVKEICKLDDKKDHYPLKMTNLQIMGAIKEAYENAYKTNRRRMQHNKDKRTGEQSSSIRGQRLYRGVSDKYGLTIEFWFNLDLNVIESAYPVMSDKGKKH